MSAGPAASECQVQLYNHSVSMQVHALPYPSRPNIPGQCNTAQQAHVTSALKGAQSSVGTITPYPRLLRL
jgi:hypothetical protein